MLKLTNTSSSLIPVEAECITPDQLAGKTVAEIAALPVQHGNAQVSLGEFFRVAGDAGDGQIILEGDCSRVKWVGAHMKSGNLTISGNIGMHAGAEMRGGTIEVHGNAGDWLGAEMSGGMIRVRGDAGHCLGGCYRGGRTGMRGGVILIDGQAGNETGYAMRRGFIAIAGSAGDFTGVSMIAGTVFVFGKSGIRPGAGMKRGTIAFFGDNPPLLPTFRYNCVFEPLFLRMYFKHLRDAGFPYVQDFARGVCRRYSGDLVASGKGEILIYQPNVDK
jgi:formylmethanofuran dehydrogenase subunit C